MGDELTVEQVATHGDTDVLWEALLRAKAAHDAPLVRAIENRMRELSVERRFAHLTDEELAAQIAGLQQGRRQGTDELIAHSPPGGSGGGGNDDAPHITHLNNSIRDNQAVGINRTLGALRDELARRREANG